MNKCVRCSNITVNDLHYCYDCWKYISMDIESPHTRLDLYEIEVYEMEELK